MRHTSPRCAPTRRFARGMTALSILSALILSGCQSVPPVTVTGCPLDEALIADLPMPSRPARVPTPAGMGHTNAQWLQSWSDLRAWITEDNARKAELRRQIGACR